MQADCTVASAAREANFLQAIPGISFCPDVKLFEVDTSARRSVVTTCGKT